ncbi:MAG TPA: hypothetical protein VI386_32820 [Candidatus Sulfotelmatobacter sp.]
MAEKTVEAVVWFVLEHETVPVCDITLEIVEITVWTICPVQPVIHANPKRFNIRLLEIIELCPRIQFAMSFQESYSPLRGLTARAEQSKR